MQHNCLDVRALIGKIVAGDYPAANYTVARQRLERRTVRVDRVRILDEEPLDPMTLALDPHLRRGTVLITGLDIDKGQERSFYLDSMHNLRIVDPQSEVAISIRAFAVVISGPNGHRVSFIETDEQQAVKYASTWNCAPARKAYFATVYPISAAIRSALPKSRSA